MRATRGAPNRRHGGSAVAFALVLIMMLALMVFLFNSVPADSLPTDFDLRVLFGTAGSTKLRPSPKEGRAREVPLVLDHVLFLPLMLR